MKRKLTCLFLGMSTLFAFYGGFALTDFIVTSYPGYKGEYVISLVLLLGESIFKFATYSDRYRNFGIRTKLLSHHLVAMACFIAIPLLSLIGNKAVGFSFSLICFMLISGYFITTTLDILASEFSGQHATLLQYWAIGKGLSSIVASVLRIIAVLSFKN